MELEASGKADAGWSDGEEALIAAARRDPAAFAAIYQQHYQTIARYLFRRTGDAHATEDLTADVFVAALRRLGAFRWYGISVRFWLYRIATNAANRWSVRMRRDALRQQALEPHTLDAKTTAIEAAAPADREERDGQVRRALFRLSPAHQAVIGLHYIEGLNVTQTAAVLGCRVGTVKSRLSRARDELRAAILNGR